MAEQPKATEQKSNPFVEKYLSEEETKPLMLFSRETRATHFLEAFKNIQVRGSLLVKGVGHSAVISAFNSLKAKKLIKPDEYQISRRGKKGEERQTFVVRLK